MTCIVGIEKDGKAFIGGDSASGVDTSVRAVITEKVFRKGKFVFGYTTSFRMGQILRYSVDFSAPIEPIDEYYLVTEIAEKVRAAFSAFGFSKISDNEETGGQFLIGTSGKIWMVDNDYQVTQYSDGLYAIGCGSEYALGALKATEHLSIPERILKALEISTYYSAFVKPPFTILETDGWLPWKE